MVFQDKLETNTKLVNSKGGKVVPMKEYGFLGGLRERCLKDSFIAEFKENGVKVEKQKQKEQMDSATGKKKLFIKEIKKVVKNNVCWQ